jgi:hypothetical protein
MYVSILFPSLIIKQATCNMQHACIKYQHEIIIHKLLEDFNESTSKTLHIIKKIALKYKLLNHYLSQKFKLIKKKIN